MTRWTVCRIRSRRSWASTQSATLLTQTQKQWQVAVTQVLQELGRVLHSGQETDKKSGSDADEVSGADSAWDRQIVDFLELEPKEQHSLYGHMI